MIYRKFTALRFKQGYIFNGNSVSGLLEVDTLLTVLNRKEIRTILSIPRLNAGLISLCSICLFILLAKLQSILFFKAGLGGKAGFIQETRMNYIYPLPKSMFKQLFV